MTILIAITLACERFWRSSVILKTGKIATEEIVTCLIAIVELRIVHVTTVIGTGTARIIMHIASLLETINILPWRTALVADAIVSRPIVKIIIITTAITEKIITRLTTTVDLIKNKNVTATAAVLTEESITLLTTIVDLIKNKNVTVTAAVLTEENITLLTTTDDLIKYGTIFIRMIAAEESATTIHFRSINMASSWTDIFISHTFQFYTTC